MLRFRRRVLVVRQLENSFVMWYTVLKFFPKIVVVSELKHVMCASTCSSNKNLQLVMLVELLSCVRDWICMHPLMIIIWKSLECLLPPVYAQISLVPVLGINTYVAHAWERLAVTYGLNQQLITLCSDGSLTAEGAGSGDTSPRKTPFELKFHRTYLIIIMCVC